YPGGSGPDAHSGLSFCSDSLAPQSGCVLSVSYTGTATGSGLLTVDLTGAYTPTATYALRGTAAERALVTVRSNPSLVWCTDNCDPSYACAVVGFRKTVNLFVTNRGALAVTSLGEGTRLAAPFDWAGGAFPGGTGSVTWIDGTSYPYCT